MWGICDWLCPKRKHRQTSYDVHQQTFQMDENIGDLGDPDSQKHQDEPIAQQSAQQFNPYTKIQEEPNNHHHQNSEIVDQRKYIQQKNKIQEQSHPKSPTTIPPTQSQKPQYNILPSKIKKKVNLDDYRFINQVEQFRVKKIGTLNGQQFNIDNCKNCHYFIFDVTANLYIDDSQNCFVYVAPCQSTIFVRNCRNLVIVAATGQFRTFQCHDCHVSLFCKSQPVIQSSTGMHFSGFSCPEYPELWRQFEKIRLYPWNNNWTEIHNFTPNYSQDKQYYTLSKKPEYPIQIDWTKAFQQAQLQLINQIQTAIPFIQGKLPLQNQPIKALLIFNEQLDDRKLVDWVFKNNLLILKANKNALGSSKNKIVALLIQYNENWDLDLTEVGDPVFVIDAQEIKQKEGKYFVSFGDQR